VSDAKAPANQNVATSTREKEARNPRRAHTFKGGTDGFSNGWEDAFGMGSAVESPPHTQALVEVFAVVMMHIGDPHFFNAAVFVEGSLNLVRELVAFESPDNLAV